MEAILATRTTPMSGRFVRYWLPVFGYVGLIIFLSAQPGLRPPGNIKEMDKVAHITEYFFLGLLLARAWTATLPPQRMMLPIVIAMIMGISIGAGDEYFQSFIPQRDSSVYDLIADSVGLLIAQMVYLFARKD